jgi:C-terminal processing protease CtpA/Prc
MSLLYLFGCYKEEFGGLGIQVPAGEQKVSGKTPFVIISVFKGGTAELAGIKAKDTIIRIDNVALNGLTQRYIVKKLLRGKIGSEVTLEVKRNNAVHVFRVKRGAILLQEKY